MTIDDIQRIELEITSNCNAACPGCIRTSHSHLLEIIDFKLSDLIRMFPNEHYIKEKEFTFSGVLGDPAIHPELVEMIEYILKNNGSIGINTNAGVGTEEKWNRLGKLCKKYPKQCYIHFCIDGHKETNHIYRVNTKFNVIERNLLAFSKNAPKNVGSWIYIVFDHNEHEIATAKEHAEKLGLKFATRTSMRNSYRTWISQTKTKKITKENIITTSKEHHKKEQVLLLDSLIQTNKVDQSIVETIRCKHIHQKEIFINSKQEMYPCCFLWDSMFKNRENMKEKFDNYNTGWNSLKDKSINDVLNHPWYSDILEKSWNPTHEKHLTRCIRTCAFNKAYQNEITYE